MKQRALARPLITDQSDLHGVFLVRPPAGPPPASKRPIRPAHVLPPGSRCCLGVGGRNGRGKRPRRPLRGAPSTAARRSGGPAAGRPPRQTRAAFGRRREPCPAGRAASRSGDRTRFGSGGGTRPARFPVANEPTVEGPVRRSSHAAPASRAASRPAPLSRPATSPSLAAETIQVERDAARVEPRTPSLRVGRFLPRLLQQAAIGW